MKLLFIGNSHTYYNSMPETVMRFLEATGQKVHVTMLTEGGKDLRQLLNNPHTVFNIRCGKYDAIIAQERATGFDAATFKESAKALKELANSESYRFGLFMTAIPRKIKNWFQRRKKQ